MRLFPLFTLALLLIAPAAPAADARFVEIPATPAVLDQLRQGGFVLYLRHGSTDNSRADLFPGLDLADCSTQRVLTDGGRKMASRVGEAMHKARLPVAEIRVSPLCRTRDTAALAFPGQAAEVSPLARVGAGDEEAHRIGRRRGCRRTGRHQGAGQQRGAKGGKSEGGRHGVSGRVVAEHGPSWRLPRQF